MNDGSFAAAAAITTSRLRHTPSSAAAAAAAAAAASDFQPPYFPPPYAVPQPPTGASAVSSAIVDFQRHFSGAGGADPYCYGASAPVASMGFHHHFQSPPLPQQQHQQQGYIGGGRQNLSAEFDAFQRGCFGAGNASGGGAGMGTYDARRGSATGAGAPFDYHQYGFGGRNGVNLGDTAALQQALQGAGLHEIQAFDDIALSQVPVYSILKGTKSH